MRERREEEGEEEEEKESLLSPEFVLTKKRWLVLFIAFLGVFIDIYGVSSFAFVNDVASSYFRTPPADTDLLSTINLFVRAFVGVFIAFGCRLMDTRSLTLTATSVIATSYILIAVGVSGRNNYPIVVLGQVISGLAAAAVVILPSLVSRHWFPRSEYGIAFALPWAARRISMAISSICSTYPIHMTRHIGNLSFSEYVDGELNFPERTYVAFRRTFQATFFTFTGVAMVTFVLGHLIVTDHPKKGDRIIQLPKKEKTSTGWDLAEQSEEFLQLLRTPAFLIYSIAYSFLLATKPTLNVLLSSMVLAVFPHLDDKIPAQMFCIAFMAGCVGGPLAGVVLDRYRRHKIASMIGLGFVVFAIVFLIISFHIESLACLYVAYTVLLFTREFAFVSLSQSVLEAVPTTDKLRMSSLFLSVPLLPVIGYSAAMRALLEKCGVLVAAGFPLPFLLSGILLIACLKPECDGSDGAYGPYNKIEEDGD